MADQRTQERCPTCASDDRDHKRIAVGYTIDQKVIRIPCTDPWHDQQDVEGVAAMISGAGTPSTTTEKDLQTLRDAVNDAYSLNAFETLHSDASGALDRIEALLRPATEPAIIHRDARGLLAMTLPEGVRSIPVAREVLEQFITDANRQTFRIAELERALVKHHDIASRLALEDWGKQCPICVGLFPEVHIPEVGEA